VRTLVVVPTHNEESNIVEILDRLRDVVPDADIMVVDDASTDGTRRLVKERIATDERLRIEERAAKRGLGDAYLHAFRIALDEGYEAVVEIDADMSHDPEVLPTMLDVAERGIALVIGSRYVPGGAGAPGCHGGATGTRRSSSASPSTTPPRGTGSTGRTRCDASGSTACRPAGTASRWR
jgi:glycosyltransferase involved in cell wall biosynthesis